MAQRREVVLVCDLCESDELVQTHRVTLDGHAIDAEACDECWSKVMGSFAVWARLGRTPERKRARIKDVVSWPDTPWRFTAHALERMGMRKISPASVLKVIAEPEIRRPGNSSNEEVWSRNGTKVVVVPDMQVIVTVASTEEDIMLIEGASA